jgi:hypothetical protein
MIDIIQMGLVVGVISITITKGSIFGWLRDRVGGWMGELLSCPYCMAHWVGLVVVISGEPGIVYRPYSLVMDVFSVIGISMISGWMVYRGWMGMVIRDMSGEVEVLREELERLRRKNGLDGD